MKKFFKELFKMIKRDFAKFAELIRNNINFILHISYLLIIILSIFLNLPDVTRLIILSSSYIFISIILKVTRRMKITLPVLKEDLTFENENGDVIVKEGSLNKLIIYCNIVEKYIKKNGLR